MIIAQDNCSTAILVTSLTGFSARRLHGKFLKKQTRSVLLDRPARLTTKLVCWSDILLQKLQWTDLLIYCIAIRNVQVIHIRKNNLDVKVQVGRDSCLSTLLDDWWVSFFLLCVFQGTRRARVDVLTLDRRCREQMSLPGTLSDCMASNAQPPANCPDSDDVT